MLDNKKAEEFLKQVLMKEPQKKPSPEDELDEKILTSVMDWLVWRSDGYRRFRNKGKTDAQYCAYNYAKAGVQKEKAWYYFQKHYGVTEEEQATMKEEFDQEYDKTAFDSKRRDWFGKL